MDPYCEDSGWRSSQLGHEDERRQQRYACDEDEKLRKEEERRDAEDDDYLPPTQSSVGSSVTSSSQASHSRERSPNQRVLIRRALLKFRGKDELLVIEMIVFLLGCDEEVVRTIADELGQD